MSGRFCAASRGAFVVAHRGAASEAPENTLPAFELAMARGCGVLECDVRLSSDGVVVVMHDTTMIRTTDATGLVEALPWQRIASADAGYRQRFGERFSGTGVPRLEQLLELARGRAEVMVEIKEGTTGHRVAGLEAATLRAVADMRMQDAVGVISMSAAVVRRVRQLAPATTTGLVFRPRRRRNLVEAAIGAGAEFMIGATRTLLAAPRLCAQARERGLRVGAYVVDSVPQAHRLLACGVESLACDDPASILPALAGALP